jgi:DNA-binding transcriptional regulator LsrR (DeoR family)
VWTAMSKTRTQEIIKICYLYYKEGKTQEEVAGLLGVSRFKVSRILKKAIADGLVTITVNDPMGNLTEMEVELAKAFDLKESVIVKAMERAVRQLWIKSEKPGPIIFSESPAITR